ncbi:MAG: hypothetical protein U5J63_07935 [Fodinibius sp.]|nr:hypothetical protein [Fodinibius sp.]
MRRYLLLSLTCLLIPVWAQAQDVPFNISAEFKTAAATNGELPFWLYANQWGEVDPSGANAILNTEISKTLFQDSDRWDLEFGAELTSRVSESPSYFLSSSMPNWIMGFSAWRRVVTRILPATFTSHSRWDR